MMMPLFFLAIGSVVSGWFFVDLFTGKNSYNFWTNSIFILSGHDALINAFFVPKWVKLFPIVLGILGISIATIFYVLTPELPRITSIYLRPLYLLSFNNCLLYTSPSPRD